MLIALMAQMNGIVRTLIFRQRLFLEHHDEEASGAHAIANDTSAKIVEVCWWPSLLADAQR